MMIRNLLLVLVTFSLSFPAIQAQDMSWRKHRKLAEQLEKEGDLFAAAENYRAAWQQKQSKEEYIYKAADIFYRLNDFCGTARLHADQCLRRLPRIGNLHYGQTHN